MKENQLREKMKSSNIMDRLEVIDQLNMIEKEKTLDEIDEELKMTGDSLQDWWLREIIHYGQEVFQHLDGDYGKIHEYGSNEELISNELNVINLYYDIMRSFTNHPNARNDIDWVIDSMNFVDFFNGYQNRFITL